MPESKTSPRRLEAIERQRKALELRRAGAQFDAIATQLGYASPGAAHVAVDSALKRTLQEPADAVRRLEVDRLDRLFLAWWPAALQGDAEACDRVLKIMARRAKLQGLDAPTKNTLTDGDGKTLPLSFIMLGTNEKPNGDRPGVPAAVGSGGEERGEGIGIPLPPWSEAGDGEREPVHRHHSGVAERQDEPDSGLATP